MSDTEDTLGQHTTAEYVRKEPGWESVSAYNNKIFAPTVYWLVDRNTTSH